MLVLLGGALGLLGCGDDSPDDDSGGAAGMMGAMDEDASIGGDAGVSGDTGSSAEPTADAGMMTSDDAGEDAGMLDDPSMGEDLGEGDGSDVITIGDSWMLLGFNGTGTGIQTSLLAVSEQPYRVYGQGGTRMLNGAIPGQYDTAKGENPDIKTVVMTGGGNDIIQIPGLREDCDAGGEECEVQVGMILDALSDLWATMAADGVQDVIYVQYATPAGMNVDFMTPSGDGVIPRCEDVPEPLRCHRLETLDIVMGDIPDGIHPSSAAYDRIGEAVYDLMVEEGMRR